MQGVFDIVSYKLLRSHEPFVIDDFYIADEKLITALFAPCIKTQNRFVFVF